MEPKKRHAAFREALQKARESARSLVKDLHQALGVADPVAGVYVLELIKQVSKIDLDVEALAQAAVEGDGL